MTSGQRTITVLLVAMTVAAGVAVYLSSTSAPVILGRKRPTAPANRQPAVDQRLLQTARRLAPYAATREEKSLSRDILRLADHEVDLAFADALLDAKEHPPTLTPEARAIADRVDHLQATVAPDTAQIKTLTTSLAAATGARADALKDQLDVAQAQLAVDQDELDDAKEDLTRAGGDPGRRIQRLLDQHDAAQHAADAAPPPATPDIPYTANHLIAQVRAWFELRSIGQDLEAARQESASIASALSAEHDALEKHVETEATDRDTARQHAADLSRSAATATPDAQAHADRSAEVNTLKHFSEDQRAMSDLDKRVQDAQDIATNYAAWAGFVSSHQRQALHGIALSSFWLLAIALVGYSAGQVVNRSFKDLAPEQRGRHTVHLALRFALQVICLALALFVIFGMPGQITTILGLAGAGLTVALKDFIVGFLGWFVLMGRNGIRVGDWVEINGVGGEVVEIGVLRTVLLETGNWTDSGHPTGRRVAFVNSFAVEGHYFNFSTSGQWLWDELRILVPPGDNPYALIDGIQKVVSAETEANARLAEQEWQRTTSRYRVKAFSAAPSIQVRPTTQGIEVIARYITRAHERHETRARLYQQVVDLMHRRP
jgi:small-conductance mechanosensitive channel